MARQFAVSFDYRCPFARNAHEHLVAGLGAGADWDVRFVPFSLNQVHVEEGQPAVWDDPEKQPSLLAMQVGVAVRDNWPDAFRRVHIALFAARHDQARDIREADVLRDVLKANGVEPDAVFAEIDSGRTATPHSGAILPRITPRMRPMKIFVVSETFGSVMSAKV